MFVECPHEGLRKLCESERHLRNVCASKEGGMSLLAREYLKERLNKQCLAMLLLGFALGTTCGAMSGMALFR